MASLPKFAVIADAHIYRTAGIQDQHLQMALTKAAGADFLVLAGDLVEDGHRLSYENLSGIMAQSPLPWFPLLGNKEISQNSTQRYRSYFGRPYYTVERSGYRLIVLGLHNFSISPGQMRWLHRVLQDTAPHHNTIIFGHHYLEYFPQTTRERFVNLCEMFHVKHFVTAHAHKPRLTQYGPLTEHLVQAIDPDKALQSVPGFTLMQLQGEHLQTDFVPVTIPAAQVQVHLLDQLGLAPAGDWGPPQRLADLCAGGNFRSYQLRIGRPDSFRKLVAEAEIARSHGLQLVGHLPGPDFDAGGHLRNQADMVAATDFCHREQAALLILHPPKLPADVICDPYGRLNTNRPVVPRIIEQYAELVGYMEGLGLPVALENNSSKQRRTTFGGLPSHLTSLASPLRERGLSPGFCFDIGHAKASVAQAQVSEWMAALGGDLLALHLHTGDPATRTTHEAIEELFATTRWYGLAAALAYRQLDIPCLLEVRTPEAAVESVEALRELPETCASEG